MNHKAWLQQLLDQKGLSDSDLYTLLVDLPDKVEGELADLDRQIAELTAHRQRIQLAKENWSEPTRPAA